MLHLLSETDARPCVEREEDEWVWDEVFLAALVEEPEPQIVNDDDELRDDGADSPWTIEAVDGDQDLDLDLDDIPPDSASTVRFSHSHC